MLTYLDLLNKIGLKRLHYTIVSYVLSIIVTIVVYTTGGTTMVYTNLMYLPITLISITSSRLQAVVHSLISGLLLGPLMPLDVSSGVMQKAENWIIRIVIYFLVAFVIGLFKEYYEKEFNLNMQIQKRLAEANMATVYAMAKLTECRDDDTGLHIERVAALCRLLAEKLQQLPEYKDYVTDNYIENLYRACHLHDIGKIGMPDNILLKTGRLSPDEYNLMKTHTIIGSETLNEVQKKYPNNMFLKLAIKISRSHHEKWDGSGYPDGLKGEDIPLSARIMAVIDVYDALRSKRVYKPAYSHESSLETIKQGSETHFDPLLVRIFLENESEFKEIYDNFSKSHLTN
ncbi:MAG TPA: HD domain-containing protein [Clostridiales bacterium]|nr:HD domain-containing protein [Clostridiales bacterium]